MGDATYMGDATCMDDVIHTKDSAYTGRILSNRRKRNKKKKVPPSKQILQISIWTNLMFHKMSKVFDKGGAKGLLLIKLDVATDGCRIVLDTKKEDSLLPTENAVSHRD